MITQMQLGMLHILTYTLKLTVIKEILIGTTSSGMEYRIIREIYAPYAGASGMLLHINGKFTMGKLKSSLLS
jgi:hypothetical protein